MESWLHTFTGKKFDPLNPRVEDVATEDIAHALAMTSRFSGHGKDFYSVAQHSVYVSRVAEDIAIYLGLTDWDVACIAAEGMIHDSSEFVLCDVPKPIKHAFSVNGKSYRKHEDKIVDVVRKHLRFPYEVTPQIHDIVKQADVILLGIEADALLHGTSEWDYQPPEWKDIGFSPLPWQEAKEEFLRRLTSVAKYLLLLGYSKPIST